MRACGARKQVSSQTCMAYDVQGDNAKKFLASAWARFVWLDVKYKFCAILQTGNQSIDS